jgi:hypothetical protein
MTISVAAQASLINSANNFVFALYDASAPSVLLESIAPAKPYANPLQVTFTYNCLSGKIYNIKLFESADTTPSGAVRGSFSQSANGSTVLIRATEYLQVGVTPGLTAGETLYEDTSWLNWNYKVTRNPDVMIPDDTTNTDPNYHKEATGGFSLIVPGDQFQPGEDFIIEFEPQVTPITAGTPSAIFSTGRIITANESLDNTDLDQALIIQSATSKINVKLPLLATIGDFKFVYLYSCGGSHKNAVIATQGSDKINYNGDKGEIILGQCEALKVYKAFGKWQVDNDLPGVRQAGELLYNYFKDELNTLECKGQLINREDYPRITAYVNTLDADSVVTDSAWTSTFQTIDGVTVYTKKHCFSSGDGSTTIRLPLLNNTVLKGIDGTTRKAGSFQMDQILDHAHGTPHSSNTPNTNSGYVSGSNKVNDETNKTGGAINTDGSAMVRKGNENLVRNAGVYALIRI